MSVKLWHEPWQILSPYQRPTTLGSVIRVNYVSLARLHDVWQLYQFLSYVVQLIPNNWLSFLIPLPCFQLTFKTIRRCEYCWYTYKIRELNLNYLINSPLDNYFSTYFPISARFLLLTCNFCIKMSSHSHLIYMIILIILEIHDIHEMLILISSNQVKHYVDRLCFYLENHPNEALLLKIQQLFPKVCVLKTCYNSLFCDLVS